MPTTDLPPVGGHGAAAVAEIDDLVVGFSRDGRKLTALRGVDLRIAEGEIVGLVGESGSGKSVLGLSLLGLLPDDATVSGQVVVDGVELNSADEKTRRRIRRQALGAVFQDPMTSLDPTMRVGKQVAEVTGDTAEAVRLLGAVGIPDPDRRLRDYPHQLSGGLRQRVMLAIALAGQPRLVVADEPTTALDVTVQKQVLELFRRLRDDIGCAILLITHDLAVASTVADRICVLYGGRIAEVGDAAAVLTRPAHPYTASLLHSRIGLAADRATRLPVIAGEPIDPQLDPVGCNFAPRCVAADERCRDERPLLQPVEAHRGSAACHYEAGERVARILSDRLPWPNGRGTPRGGVAANGISVEFGSRDGRGRRQVFSALRSVDLTVGPGEAVALVGESGSGKTTLLRVLAGLQPTSSGTVERVGRPPQMIFQDAGSSFTPWLTVGQHLEERVHSLPRGERRQRVTGVLEQLGLPASAASVRARRLSGGQRQRIAIARAIIEPPDLLLCDEPTSALDASLAATVLNLLGELRRGLGFSMVFVTHDLAAARLVADRIVVMNEGSIVEQGDAEQVLSAPTEAYTRRLLRSVPEIHP